MFHDETFVEHFEEQKEEYQSAGSDKSGTFLHEISEKHFWDERYGGHAFNGEGEFFASLMNVTLTRSDEVWQESVLSKSPEFREQYGKALDLVRDVLLEKGVSADAPAFEILSRRRAML